MSANPNQDPYPDLYAAKPWLSRYSSWVPATLPLPTRTLIDTFEDTAARRPASPAVHYFGDTITFGALDRLGNAFAARLAQWNIGHGDRIAIWTQNDPEFLIAAYAAWKRGAIAVPLSPMFKQREMEYHLRDSGARVLVCREELFGQHAQPILGGTQVEQTVFTAGLIESLAAEPAATAPPAIRPSLDDPAYLVYTSGTTGQPKGAMCLHRNIAYNTEVFRTWMQIGAQDTILGMAPLFHITGLVAEIALSALSGAPLVLYHRFDPERTFEMIERWQPTYALAAITAYLALMNHADASAARFRSMTKCYTGGAPVPPAVVDAFERKFGAYVHNTYGLTESNSPSTITPADARGPVDPVHGALSIGVPIPGMEARIVGIEDSSRDVPPGESGELALRGPMIFPGYWNKSEESAKAFHNGWFLTGDIATMDAEGWIYLVDRKKDMIVASGYKVWPREVEDVLYQHPAVKEAAVVGVPDEYRGETVKAFVSLREGANEVTPAAIVAFCRERMAAYKYPREVEFVAEIPKTATGKFLRRALRTSGS